MAVFEIRGLSFRYPNEAHRALNELNLTVSPGDSALRRNALLLYPMIWEGKMSHGRAAEILGVKKLDLIDL